MLKHIVVVSSFFVLISSSSTEESLQTFVERNSWFSASSYKHVTKQIKHDENFLICPFSAEIALSLAQSGAKGKTRQEIRNALHLPNSTEGTNLIFKNILTHLKQNEAYTIHTANKIFVSQNYKIKEHFTKIASEIYDSSSENVDFTNRNEATNTINNWVAEKTENKIQNMVDPEKLRPDTVAVLINALYFQAKWRKNFKKSLTRNRDFFKNGETPNDVETMLKSDFYGYFENAELDAKFLQIQFKSGRTASMVVVLPNEKTGLPKLEKQIEHVYKKNFTWEYVDVALPKFKIETSIDYKRILKKLGVKRAFTRADFSALAGQRGEIFITDVFQKTYIDVNEDGVEAAAATSISYAPKSLMDFTGEKKSFIADHPFLFYILVDNIVVFTGRVVDP